MFHWINGKDPGFVAMPCAQRQLTWAVSDNPSARLRQ